MTRKINRMLPALCLTGFVTLSGCVAYGPGVGLRVGFGPPGFRTEVALASPGAGYVWVPGYWDWQAERADYFWVEGRWILPPHARAVWVAPRYERHHGGWYYRRGHWR